MADISLSSTYSHTHTYKGNICHEDTSEWGTWLTTGELCDRVEEM